MKFTYLHLLSLRVVAAATAVAPPAFAVMVAVVVAVVVALALALAVVVAPAVGTIAAATPTAIPANVSHQIHLHMASPLADGVVLCVHGGLSPEVRTIDQLNVINRLQEIPHEGAFCDMMWSDPDDIPDAWKISPRGATSVRTSPRVALRISPRRAAPRCAALRRAATCRIALRHGSNGEFSIAFPRTLRPLTCSRF